MSTLILLDGRAGQVVYLNDVWVPVAPEDATHAEVRFTDGASSLFALHTRAADPVEPCAPYDTVFKKYDPNEPRDHGKWTTGTAHQRTLVGITAARPGTPPKEVFEHMREFGTQLQALPGVKDATVQPGVGAWQGGAEPTWVVGYNGNGEAYKLLAETGKKYHQDAVLILHQDVAPNTKVAPSTEWTFEHGLGAQQREVVGKILADQGIGGWTWFKHPDGSQVLRTVAVPQWGGDPEAHAKAVEVISQTLAQGGLKAKAQTVTVNAEVVEREGTHTYDEVLAKKQEVVPVVEAPVSVPVAPPLPAAHVAPVKTSRVVTYAEDGQSATVTTVTPEGQLVGPVRKVEFTATGRIARITETEGL